MMRLADRAPQRIIAAPFTPKHWRALLGILTTTERPLEVLRRYLLNRGNYPWEVALRTPLGVTRAGLQDRHDLLTLCEVFCRRDYGDDAPRLVVDIGANIGLAALFFLTRRPDSFVVCCEPDPANLALLRRNLSAFSDRYELRETAVVAADGTPTVRFTPAGRYGHVAAGGPLAVPSVAIAPLLREVTEARGRVDLVKIDTEGTETALLQALMSHGPRPRAVRWEDNDGHVRLLSFA